MARISNKTKYPINKDVGLSDYLVGTRSSDKTTLNFEIQNFLNTINEANGISTSQFKFSLDEDIHLTEAGFVSTNGSETDPANVTLLRFSTEDLSGNDLTDLISALNDNNKSSLVKLADPANPNSIIVFEPTGIDVSNVDYIDLSVIVFGTVSTVSFVEDTIYSFDYYIFQEAGITSIVEDTTPELGGDLDALNQDINNVKELGFQGGQKLSWNTKYHTINVPTGDGSVTKVGMDTLFDIHNATGGLLTKGTVVYPDGTSTLGVSNVQKCIADSFETIQSQVGIVAADIVDGADGHVLVRGVIDPIDTSLLSVGQIYLSPTNAGEFTNVKPEFPNYVIPLGVVDSSAVEGIVTIDSFINLENILANAWDGTIMESFDFRITSNGATITGTLTNPNATHNDLTCIFSDNFYTFDAPVDGTVTLVQGSSTIPQMNYVYIDATTKALTVSTSDFPETEHAKVAIVAVLDATTTQNNGALRNQNTNDHVKKDSNNGHLLHMAERIRSLNADWYSGVDPVLSGTPTNLYLSTTSGKVWQMHRQTFVAQNMATGSDMHIVNDPTTAYRTTTNLNDITEYSDGSSWNNEWQNIVVWGVCNKTGEMSHLMANLSSDGYTSESDAVNDESNFSNYVIPIEFKGVGFLIGRFTIRRSGANFTYNSGVGFLDLRGYYPNNTAGGGTGSSGITTFLGLTDTPSSYTSQAGKIAQINTGETGLEFVDNIPTSGTGTVIDLSNYRGHYMNMSSANTATTYTTTGQELGGFAVIRINAVSQPTVTGADMISGSLFVSSTDMHMVVQYFGTTTQYYFLAL